MLLLLLLLLLQFKLHSFECDCWHQVLPVYIHSVPNDYCWNILFNMIWNDLVSSELFVAYQTTYNLVPHISTTSVVVSSIGFAMYRISRRIRRTGP
jgi:hypothetical protein